MTYSPNYDYTASKAYCEQLGLFWRGDEFLEHADTAAFNLNFTQAQFDAAMVLHLWEVKNLFTPKNYKALGRILMAIYFLTGWKPKPKE